MDVMTIDCLGIVNIFILFSRSIDVHSKLCSRILEEDRHCRTSRLAESFVSKT